jgi:hypothetical protein
MNNGDDWQHWQAFFEARSGRPLPALDLDNDYSDLPGALAESLAIFQLGESGGGTVIEQARRSRLPGTGEGYARAIELFVAEEHRHANLLAMGVRLLGGRLKRRNWTARLFVLGRRLLGLRLKVLVLLAAEVVGICFYLALASAIKASPLKSWLLQIIDDERAHLEFHSEFLRLQFERQWHKQLFIVAWRTIITTAAIVVMLDHRRTIRELGLGFRCTWGRWMAIADLAQNLVLGKAESRLPDTTSGCTAFRAPTR